MTIKAVLFDLDDTLLWDERSVEEAFDATCQYANEQSGVAPKQLEEAVRASARQLYATYETYAFTQNIGINPFEALWAHFTGGEHEEFRVLQKLVPQYRVAAWTEGLRNLGVDNEQLGQACAERFMEERRKRPYVYEDTFEVLKKLKAKYPLLLLTNGAPCLQQEKLDGVPAISSYFDHVVISGRFSEGKPSRIVFEHAMKLLNIRPHEGLMVGDKLTTDIQGSVSIGMHNAWLNRNDKPLTGDIKPEYSIQSLHDLFDVIESINKQQEIVN
ncbi:HAD family hydrolase [Paenibacillus assamensis]|uniref:HAD family hydrolase n=1 Tax=Paenibacillus assamensis TaxID=311244 RepID=UPI0003FC2E9C|nr:HAD family hydrolase [Paenibacillus assamensis]